MSTKRCTKIGDLVRVLGGVHRGYKFRVTEITERGELKGHAVHPNVELYCGDVEVVPEQPLPIIPMSYADPIETGPLTPERVRVVEWKGGPLSDGRHGFTQADEPMLVVMRRKDFEALSKEGK